MAYVLTFDEKQTGYYSIYASAYSDAPASIGTKFTLAKGITAYGLLSNTGFIADLDAYSMGLLYGGTYSVSASNANWFFGTGYSWFVTPAVNIYNSVGAWVAGGANGNAAFIVSVPGTYYAVVTGNTLSSSQYSLTYDRQIPIEYPASGSVYITGAPAVGSTLGVTYSVFDANGTLTSSALYSWFVGSTLVSTAPTYNIQQADAGKLIVVVIQFYDDALYLETIASQALLVSSSAAAAYTIAAASSSVNEGSSATFTLSTTNVASGTVVPYTISGTITSADIVGGAITGSTTVGADGKATITVALVADNLTEGFETLTVSAGGASASTTVSDTSIYQISQNIFNIRKTIGSGSSAVAFGTTALGYAIEVGGGDPIQITYGGLNASSNKPGAGWVGLGAAISGSGYDLFWHNTINDSYALWHLDSNGILQNGKGLSGSDLYSAETALNTDLTGEGQIGSSANLTGNFPALLVSSSAAAAYTIAAASSSVNEGSSATFTLSTTNVASGTVVPYTISGTITSACGQILS